MNQYLIPAGSIRWLNVHALLPWLVMALLITFFPKANLYAQPNLVKAEYFFDTDPGFGKAINVPVSAGKVITNQNISANINTLQTGIHQMYVRVQDADGKWSISNRTFFFKMPPAPVSGLPNVVKAEYFFNTDPGFGKGSNIPITAGTTIMDKSFDASTETLPVGIHQMYVRVQDGQGKWSISNRTFFFKMPPAPVGGNLPNLVKAEYFFDADPGFGSGINIPITAGTTILDKNFEANIESLPIGVHQLLVRVQDALGKWSISNRTFFYKPPPIPTGGKPGIVQVEYFIDTDPGFGKGVPLPVLADTIFTAAPIKVNVTGLTNGKHRFFLRVKDTKGNWSISNMSEFDVTGAIAPPYIAVTGIDKKVHCAGDTFTLGYHATGTFNPGNQFTAWLSNASGGFGSEQLIGTVAATGSGLIGIKLPPHVPSGTGYRIRVKSSNTVVVGDANNIAITINDRPFAPAFTGLSNVNGGFTMPYSVPNRVGSTFDWMITGGTQASGATTNSITVAWPQPAGDSAFGSLKVVETTQFGCVGDTGTLAPIIIYPLAITITAAGIVCKGDALDVNTVISGSFGTGNTLSVQLSNATGNFATPAATASFAYVASGVNKPATFKLPIPANLPNGNGYRVRIRSSNPVFIGDTTAAIIIQKPALGPDITGSYCNGESYNLTQHFTDNALTYTYFTQAFEPVANPAMALAGVYQVIGKNSVGCPDTAMVTINMLPKPDLGADITVYHVCAGETTNLLPLYNTASLTAVWNTVNPSSAGPGAYRLIVTNTQGCTDTAFAHIVLPTAIWTGAVSTDWHTAGNWSNGKVPDASTHVIISTSTPRICIISTADGLAASVQLKNGATLQLTNGKQLIVNGNCTVLPSQ